MYEPDHTLPRRLVATQRAGCRCRVRTGGSRVKRCLGRGFSGRGVSGNLPEQYGNRRTEIHEETETQSLRGIQGASGAGGDPDEKTVAQIAVHHEVHATQVTAE